MDSFAELGRSLWPVRGYATGKIGYRWRTTNAETGIDFGNELIWPNLFGQILEGGMATRIELFSRTLNEQRGRENYY